MAGGQRRRTRDVLYFDGLDRRSGLVGLGLVRAAGVCRHQVGWSILMRHAHVIALAVAIINTQACQKKPQVLMTNTHSSNGLRLVLPESLPVDGIEERLAVTENPSGFIVAFAPES